MTGIIERIGSLAGTELAKAINLAHLTYQERMEMHGHTGRALVETVAEVARNHPNLIGIGVGLLVEQLLAEEKRRHDAHLAGVDPDSPGADVQIARAKGKAKHAPKPDEAQGASPPVPAPVLPSHHHLLPTHGLRLSSQKPGRVALEVFGALLLLKLASSGARMFRHKRQGEVWFAPAARIRLFSGTIAAYYLAKSIRSPKLSAWRNGAVAFFGTDAIKPVLRVSKKQRAAISAGPALAAAPALAPAPTPSVDPFPPTEAAPEHVPEPTPAPTAYSTTGWNGADQVQSVGTPKPDPRPMPVWPSEAKKAALGPAATTPVAVQTPAQPPAQAVLPPIDPFDGTHPPG